MWESEKTRVAKAAARLLSDYASGERMLRLWARVQHVRTILDEAQGAFWHFTAMPSRRDVRLILRRVASVRRRIAEVDRALAQVELKARARASGDALPPAANDLRPPSEPGPT